MHMCVHERVCACVSMCVRVRVCVRACVCVLVPIFKKLEKQLLINSVDIGQCIADNTKWNSQEERKQANCCILLLIPPVDVIYNCIKHHSPEA